MISFSIGTSGPPQVEQLLGSHSCIKPSRCAYSTPTAINGAFSESAYRARLDRNHRSCNNGGQSDENEMVHGLHILRSRRRPSMDFMKAPTLRPGRRKHHYYRLRIIVAVKLVGAAARDPKSLFHIGSIQSKQNIK